MKKYISRFYNLYLTLNKKTQLNKDNKLISALEIPKVNIIYPRVIC